MRPVCHSNIYFTVSMWLATNPGWDCFEHAPSPWFLPWGNLFCSHTYFPCPPTAVKRSNPSRLYKSLSNTHSTQRKLSCFAHILLEQRQYISRDIPFCLRLKIHKAPIQSLIIRQLTDLTPSLCPSPNKLDPNAMILHPDGRLHPSQCLVLGSPVQCHLPS